MNKILLTATSLILFSGCTAEITKEPAQVTSHTRVNESLDNCQRISQIKAEYEVNKDLSRRENEIQAQNNMKQQAYDEYRADNIVFINSQYVEGGFLEPDMIYNRGIAYKCYSGHAEVAIN